MRLSQIILTGAAIVAYVIAYRSGDTTQGLVAGLVFIPLACIVSVRSAVKHFSGWEN